MFPLSKPRLSPLRRKGPLSWRRWDMVFRTRLQFYPAASFQWRLLAACPGLRPGSARMARGASCGQHCTRMARRRWAFSLSSKVKAESTAWMIVGELKKCIMGFLCRKKWENMNFGVELVWLAGATIEDHKGVHLGVWGGWCHHWWLQKSVRAMNIQ